MDYQWKYRVIEPSLKWAHSADTVTFSIYEVYRDENDKIVDIARQESKPEADSADALKADIGAMMEACSLPVLNYGQITEEIAKAKSTTGKLHDV